MANREACELYIEQEIDAGLEDGKTPHSIGKELSDWVAKMFEVRINPDTLKTRAYRRKHKDDSNESSPGKVTTHAPTNDLMEEPVQDVGYKEALKAMTKAVRAAKRGKYKTIPKEGILEDIDALRGIVDPLKKPTKRQRDLQQEFWKNDDVIAKRAAFHAGNSKEVKQMGGGGRLVTIKEVISLDDKTNRIVCVVIDKPSKRKKCSG